MNSPTNGYRHHSQKEKKILSHKDACRRRPNPFHLFAPISIAMFSGLSFTPFFYLLFFGSFEGNFISVLLVMLSDFTDYIEYLLLVLLGSVVGICYIVRYKLNYCICRQTDFVGKRSLPLRLQRGSAFYHFLSTDRRPILQP